MGLRAGYLKLLAMGGDGEPDPDELVELVDPALAHGVNVHRGAVTNAAVAEALGRPFTSLDEPS